MLTLDELSRMSIARINHFLQTIKYPQVKRSKFTQACVITTGYEHFQSDHLKRFLVPAITWTPTFVSSGYHLNMNIRLADFNAFHETLYSFEALVQEDYEVGHIDLFIHNLEIAHDDWRRKWAR